MHNERKRIRLAVSRLVEPGAVLRQIDNREWGVFCKQSPPDKPALRLDVSHVLAMRSSDFVRLERDGSARLTDAGRAWLTRREATADAFFAQHQDCSIEHVHSADGNLETVTVNKAESPLYWLRSRKDKSGAPLLTEAQFQAGERLRRDFTFAQLQPKTTASWSLASGPAGRRRRHGSRMNHEQSAAESNLAARSRFNAAVSAVGPELADPLIEVCCFLHGVEETENKFAWPKRSGKLVLRLALSALARHYDDQASGSASPPRLSGTLSEGFRPAMFPGE
ncbi:MAG: DUF6456 domain-containing protein [Pseudomonadota bacterium]